VFEEGSRQRRRSFGSLLPPSLSRQIPTLSTSRAALLFLSVFTAGFELTAASKGLSDHAPAALAAGSMPRWKRLAGPHRPWQANISTAS